MGTFNNLSQTFLINIERLKDLCSAFDMSESEIVLFDLPSQEPNRCWSLNPWKSRIALNFKGLNYRTEWIEYPDIAPKFKALGIPPNPKDVNPNFEYSIPAMRISGGDYIMDSLAIAKAVDHLKPQPSLHLNSGYVELAQAALGKTLMPLRFVAMPRVPTMLLTDKSRGYFEETREKSFGKPLSEVAKSDEAKNAWTNAQPGVEELQALLNEHQEGPYLMGTTPSYADFILAGLWRFLELLDKDGDLFGHLMKQDESFMKHYQACKQWMERESR